MGKKYIIELEDKPFELLNKDGITSEKLYRVKGFNSLVFDWNGLQMLTPYTEPDLEQVRKEAYKEGREAGIKDGMCEAWEAARKIATMPYGEEEKAFGSGGWTFITNHTASEAIEKIRQYEQEKKEIKVGDEVIPRETEYDTMIVTRLWKDDCDFNCIDAIGFDGRISSFLVSRVSKTGKHYEIAAVLAKMKES